VINTSPYSFAANPLPFRITGASTSIPSDAGIDICFAFGGSVLVCDNGSGNGVGVGWALLIEIPCDTRSGSGMGYRILSVDRFLILNPLAMGIGIVGWVGVVIRGGRGPASIPVRLSANPEPV
jgi:hypothetical protein